MNLHLYHSVESTCSQKVRFVLCEKHLHWEQIDLNLRKGDQFDPDYLKLNPKAVVPTLIHDEQVIRESTVIIEYLDDVFPEPELRPDAPHARALMRLLLKAFDEEVHPGVGILSYAIVLRHQMNSLLTPEALQRHFQRIVDPRRRERQQGVHHEGLNAATAAMAIVSLAKVMGLMEAALTAHAYLAGDRFSLADAGAAPYMMRMRNLGLSAIWQNRPTIEDWLQRVTARVDSYDLKDAWGSAAFSELVSKHVASSKQEIENLLNGSL